MCVFEAHAHTHPPDTFVRMTCYTASYSGILMANSEIEKIRWLNHCDKDKTLEVDKVIFEFLKELDLLS